MTVRQRFSTWRMSWDDDPHLLHTSAVEAADNRKHNTAWGRLVSLNPTKYPSIELFGHKYVLGRDRTKCNILHDTPHVSKEHAILQRVPHTSAHAHKAQQLPFLQRTSPLLANQAQHIVTLQDTSTNGTFIMGRKIGTKRIVRMHNATPFSLIPETTGGTPATAENNNNIREPIAYILYLHATARTAATATDQFYDASPTPSHNPSMAMGAAATSTGDPHKAAPSAAAAAASDTQQHQLLAATPARRPPAPTVTGQAISFGAKQKAPEGEVTIVFTDIERSTQLWESAGEKRMYVALKQHDALMRRLIRKFNGYEVKTEGDAFMVAFFNVLDAIAWCMAVQYALLAEAWSKELLALPDSGVVYAREQQPATAAAAIEASASSSTSTSSDVTNAAAAAAANASSTTSTARATKRKVLFRGPRVRMGIHVGKPAFRRNPITLRMDYFGLVINRAARVADTAHGGQTVCTAEVMARWNKLHKKWTKMHAREPASHTAVPALTSSHLGKFTLKGLKQDVDIFQLLPQDLSERSFPPLRNVDVMSGSKSASPRGSANIVTSQTAGAGSSKHAKKGSEQLQGAVGTVSGNDHEAASQAGVGKDGNFMGTISGFFKKKLRHKKNSSQFSGNEASIKNNSMTGDGGGDGGE